MRVVMRELATGAFALTVTPTGPSVTPATREVRQCCVS